MSPAPPLRRAIAVALVLAAASRARAEEPLGVLAVADPPGPGKELVALAGELRAALAARTGGVLDADALRARMLDRAPPAALAELDRAYAGALAAHAAGEYEQSNRTLRAIVDALEALPEGADVFAAWTRAMLRLARSEQELGRGVDAQSVLERLLRAAPDAQADSRQYPPSFRALVDEARARLRALGTRRLTVESHPAARVFVEGREVGTAPVTVELPPGRYRVAGLHGGVRAPSVVVELADDRTVALDMSLADALRPDGGPGIAAPEPGRARLVATAAARLALDRAVVAALRREGAELALVATLVDAKRAVVEREGRIRLAAGAAPAGAVDALAAYLLGAEPSPAVVPSERPSLALGPEGAERVLGTSTAGPTARRSSAAGWTAVGVGVASLALGTLAVIAAKDAQSHYDAASAMLGSGGLVAPPHTVADYNSAIAAGDQRRDSAVALGVAAGVGVATTAVLGYVSWRRTGEIGPIRF